MLQDLDELKSRADYEAAQLLEAAKAQAAHLVSGPRSSARHKSEAERMILDAEAEARRIRHEAEDYVDRKLASFEIVLDRTIRTVQAGRERLTGAPAAAAAEPTEGGGDRSRRVHPLRPGSVNRLPTRIRTGLCRRGRGAASSARLAPGHSHRRSAPRSRGADGARAQTARA